MRRRQPRGQALSLAVVLVVLVAGARGGFWRWVLGGCDSRPSPRPLAPQLIST